jgi:hypothetical protein
MTIDDLIEIVPGPDFPTGGAILGRAGIRSPITPGAARCDARQGRNREIRKDREAIIVTEIPYQVNKATADREDRRTGAREEARGHLRPARRIRPRRHAHRHRTEARRRGRCRAQPALPLHAAAVDNLRLQHDRAERRPAGR